MVGSTNVLKTLEQTLSTLSYGVRNLKEDNNSWRRLASQSRTASFTVTNNGTIACCNQVGWCNHHYSQGMSHSTAQDLQKISSYPVSKTTLISVLRTNGIEKRDSPTSEIWTTCIVTGRTKTRQKETEALTEALTETMRIDLMLRMKMEPETVAAEIGQK